LNVRLTARIQPLLRGHKYRVLSFFGGCLWLPKQNQNFFLYAIPKPYAINIITNLITVSVLNNVPACICKTHKTTQRITKSIV
jgi:hypothetical protein